MSSSARDYQGGAGRPRASSRSTLTGSGRERSSDSLARSISFSPQNTVAQGINANAERSVSTSGSAHAQFQPRIVRAASSSNSGMNMTLGIGVGAMGPPSVSSLLNSNGASGNGGPLPSESPRSSAARARRGSASSTHGSTNSSSGPASMSAGGQGPSRYHPSASLGSASIHHQQHPRMSSTSSGMLFGNIAISPSMPHSHVSSSFDPMPTQANPLISFPRPTYMEQSALRKYIQVTPYAPTPVITHSGLHHGLAHSFSHPHSHDMSTSGTGATGGVGGRRLSTSGGRNSIGSGSNRHPNHLPASLLSSIAPPGTTTVLERSQNSRRSIPIPYSSDESSGSDGGGGTRAGAPSNRRRSSVQSMAAPNTSAPPLNEVVQVPTRWNKDDKSPNLSISPDGREIMYSGSSNTTDRIDKEAAAVRANFPMPKACGIYYFEIQVLNRGQKGEIGLGFGTINVSLERLPGWSQATTNPRPSDVFRQSWGYHGDDGQSFASHDHGTPYSSGFTTSDIVGCGVDFTMKRAFYTKNGAFLGYVFDDIDGDLYPMVGLRTSGESIRANFGHSSFKFDIVSHVHMARNRTWAQIQSTPILYSPTVKNFEATSSTTPLDTSIDAKKTENRTRQAMDDLVLDYLSHHGYARTVEAFRSGISARRTAAIASKSPRAAGKAPEEPSSPYPSSSFVDSANSDMHMSTDTPLLASSSDVIASAGSASDVRARQQIQAAIRAGDIDFALKEIEARYPKALAANDGWLLFRLKCRKFVELSLEAARALKAAKPVEEDLINLSSPITVGGDGAGISTQDKGKGKGVVMGSGDTFSNRSVRTRHDLGGSAPIPINIKQSPSHARSSYSHSTQLDDGIVEEDDDAMDIDDVAEDQVVQNALLSGSPSSSSPPEYTHPILNPSPSPVVGRGNEGQSSNRKPLGFNRPFIPVSTASSSPSSTPPASLPKSHPMPVSSASHRPTISNLVTASPASSSFAVKQVAMSMSPAAQVALNHTLIYGRELHTNYSSNERPEVRELFKRTFGLVAYENPLEVGGDVSKLAGQGDRDDLAACVNTGILASLGRHASPMLKRVYQHAGSLVTHLGLSGHATAAFADIEKEFVTNDF